MSTNNTLVLVAIEVALGVNPNKLTSTKDTETFVKNSMVTPTRLMIHLNLLDPNNPYKCLIPLTYLLMWAPMMMM
jgi:hypothetical protein